ncbi:MAG: universal stress protein [Vicinamibacterales bacterium]
MTLTSILCPVDFSAHARHALRLAVALAARTGARLTVLTVTDPLLDAAARATGDHGALVQQTQDALSALLDELGPPRLSGPPAVSVLVGAAADQILVQADECGADVIVMGTQGLGGARRLLFGSTTERVLRRTSRPVLAVPSPDADAAAGDLPFQPDRLLVPVDIAQPSGDGHVTAAGEWARLFGAAVRLLYVSPAYASQAAPWQQEISAILNDRRTEASAGLAPVAARLGDGVDVAIEVRTGKPSAVIADVAAEEACGLIVLGAGGADHRPGATAYRVLCGSPVPVLVIPS